MVPELASEVAPASTSISTLGGSKDVYAADSELTEADNNVKADSAGEQSGLSEPPAPGSDSAPETSSPRPSLKSDKTVPAYNASKRVASLTTGGGRIGLTLYASGLTSDRATSVSPGSVRGVALGSDFSGWEDNTRLGIMLFNKGLDTEVSYRHHTPLRYGLSVDYPLSDRFSLGTGLMYTRLSSDFREGSDIHYYSGDQTLHYIGIPLTARYRIASWRMLSFYASAGVMAEKCVSGRMVKDYVIDNVVKETESETVKVKPVQWSVNASAGVCASLTRNLGLYVEPGVDYHISNSSPVRTIYKDKPLNFNLNLGVRITLGR